MDITNKPRRGWRSKGSDIPLAREAFTSSDTALIKGNDVALLVDGAMAYPAMIEAIESAHSFILMESYMFHEDKAGRQFAAALSAKAMAGIPVYLTIDGVGTLNVSHYFFAAMERSGVRLLTYHLPSVLLWRKSVGILQRNHRKLLVVDGAVGFVGGINIGEEWLPRDMGGEGWHDVHMKVSGPAVRELTKVFLSTWNVHSKLPIEAQTVLRPVHIAGDDTVSIVASRQVKRRKAIRRSYIRAIKEARSYIYIANAYFLPDRGVRRALRNACRRGVDVRIMVPKKGDIAPVQWASESLWGRVLRSGGRIFLWHESMLHAKTAVIDDQWATVGSFNLDHRSFTMNLEVNINVYGAKRAAELRDLFLEDANRCEALSMSAWAKRPWHIRLLQRFCHFFSEFM